jgi:phosphoserine phosphatase
VLPKNPVTLQRHLGPSRRFLETYDGQLPSDLSQSLLAVEEQLTKSKIEKKIAVFDLDNTLLVGDIGEAVFAGLKLQGYIPGFSWQSYRKLLSTSRPEAYQSIVTAMSGLSERSIHKVTLDVISKRESYLELEKSYIQVPFAHPVMLHVVARLRTLGYQICVISASNEISARMVAWKLFNIPPFFVYGIRQRLQNGILTNDLLQPIPIGSGKVEVYRKFMGSADPLITAGDSVLDVPMLQMTDPRGLSILVGEERIGYELIQRKTGGAQKFCFLPRPPQLQFDEESSDD